jgi:hypothetical protein
VCFKAIVTHSQRIGDCIRQFGGVGSNVEFDDDEAIVVLVVENGLKLKVIFQTTNI